MTDIRQEEARGWLSNTLRLPVTQFKPLAGDASFRRYFRVSLPDRTLVLMDAPPARENCHPFVAIAKQLTKQGIRAPLIVAEDLAQGFLLLEDFGDKLFLNALKSDNADGLYRQALQTLVRLQQIQGIDDYKLPSFNQEFMLQEMNLFQNWFIGGMLEYKLSPKETQLLQQTFTQIAEKIAGFQYTFTHRDYHSRNLMLLNDKALGVIDFQDAVHGPITYDALSLLKDAYAILPREKVVELLAYYHQLLTSAAILKSVPFDRFLQEFDWVGLQRHLKVIGIFCRLHLRDHKSGYLKDLPLVMSYLLDGLYYFTELNEFTDWLKNHILPVYETTFNRELIA